MSLHASLSTLSRPSLLARPIILSGAHTTTLTASRRCLHASITASARVGATRGFSFTSNKLATTALKTGVKEREEGSAGVVVGGSGKGAEGPHFQDQIPLSISLQDGAKGWTLINPIYTESEVDAVQVVGRTPVTFSDKLAHGFVKLLRGTFDYVSRYTPTHVPESVTSQVPIPVEQLRKDGKILSDKQWLLRIVLLESFAGVPGMVGGTLRHLRSLRLLRRDGGWIHTLLEEAENERMHLLTFLTIYQPTWLTRAAVLGVQGVMYNLFFLTYLFSPKTAHRFVGALEEEAVRTYTHCISDIERGLVPEWKDMAAPKIAIDYWRLPPTASLLDVVRAVRADEATHRFVNHSLADLDQKRDFNPFAIGEPSAEIRGTKAGFTREESAEFARQSQEKLMQQERRISDQ